MADLAKKKMWVPLEANPEVMEDFLQNLGFPPAAGLHDIYGLDEELLAMAPQPVLAVLLLFPEDDETQAARSEVAEKLQQQGQKVSDNVWFTFQTIGNACGTIALMHAVGNSTGRLRLAPGSFLDRFFRSTRAMQPQERARALEEDDELEAAHSSAAGRGDTTAPSTADPVPYHYLAFVCVDGDLYELDGCRPCPINHGPASQETLLKDAARAIRKFMEENPDTIHFNVIAMSGEHTD